MEDITTLHIKNSIDIDKNYLFIEKPFSDDMEVMLVPKTNMEPISVNHSKLLDYTRQIIRIYLLFHSVLP